MRTTFKMLQSVTEILRNATGINYRAFSESGSYFVAIKNTDTSLSSVIVRGSAYECHKAIRTVLNFMLDIQGEQSTTPAILIRVSDGMVQGVYTRHAAKYILVDEDHIENMEENYERIEEMATDEIMRTGIREGIESGVFVDTTDTSIKYFTADAICKAWYPETENQ